MQLQPTIIIALPTCTQCVPIFLSFLEVDKEVQMQCYSGNFIDVFPLWQSHPNLCLQIQMRKFI